ncbi:MAG TPA: FtsX-like permease family protein, partial [Gaiellaceae bacterium]|nr:FtsX-like permease family protein [Gaiellaceae bacterium]
TALSQVSLGFAVQAPLDDLAGARDRALRASRRQLLVGGQCIVVFLAFAVLAASRIRRNAQETRFRLRRLRALRWQIGLETTAYALLVVLPAVLAGLVLGAVAGAAVASAAGRPAGNAVRRALDSQEMLLAAVLLAAVATLALILTVRARTLEVRGRGITAVDVAAAAALLAVAAVLAFGQTDAESLAQKGQTGAGLLLLPVLIAVAGGLVTARVLPPLLRVSERPVAAAGVSVRLAFLSLVRNPGAAAVAVACLTVTVGMAVFALTYRATLSANQRDAAAYAAPLDYVVAPDPTRGRNAQRVDLAPRLDDGAVGVIRQDGEAPTLARPAELTVLGLPPAAFERMRWRDDYSASSPRELGRAVAYGSGGLRGVVLPREGVELVFPRTVRGDAIRLTAQILRPDGGFSVLGLGGAPGSDSVRSAIPEAARGGTLVGLTLAFPPAEAFTAAHRATGSRAAPDVFLRGTLNLGRPRIRTANGPRPLDLDYGDWVSTEGGGVGSGSSVRIRYVLTQERTFRIRPTQPTDGAPIPVIASESLADAAGSRRVLPVRIGSADVEVRIVATARRFPTLSGDFLVADRDAVSTAANTAAPGTAVADEAWVSGRPGRGAALGRLAPFPVTVISRTALEESLRADPVSRAASTALLAAMALAAALAYAGLVLALAVDARDDAAELYDLESLGFAPGRLAHHLWLRSAVILVAGLVGGLVTGALGSLLVTDVVSVTANATPAEPPLVPAVPWLALAAGVLALAAVALGSTGVLARRSFRAPAPARPEAA